MVMCLEDLINYFAQPEDDMGKNENSKFASDQTRLVLLNFDTQNPKLNFRFQSTKKNKIGFELCAIAKTCFRKKES